MLFNSIDFAVFLPIVFAIYWILNKYASLSVINFFILVVSYIFYGWWDWRFLGLLAFSSLLDFIVAIIIDKSQNQTHRKLLLYLSLTVNLGFLGFFKYANFFIENFIQAFSFLGYRFDPFSLSIILPVGISFYTFQTLSYTIDVYRKDLKSTKNIVDFFAFVSFFPQLVAGPIERATHLLPQFYSKKKFDASEASDGMRQILWGFFKKIAIADNCAVFVNHVFADVEQYNGSTLLLASVFFAFQIYCDFSGYSDIAIGVAKLFGYSLMRNFAFPYFSRDVAEFWRRWHISLSTWFRDYLYIPLGGSKNHQLRNTFIIFLVSGFWHGANWTFIFWGGLNALYFLPSLFLKQNRKNLGIASEGRIIPTLRDFINIIGTFGLTVLAWVFFRAATLSDAFSILAKVFSLSIFKVPNYNNNLNVNLMLITILVALEWLQRDKKHPLEFYNKPTWFRWACYVVIFNLLIYFGNFVNQSFIYFQF